ncbi:hypothetical protein CA13_28610 [Planctomycetes bacterium CA13]|uniref:Uncharacterized protein n=1 Tax=Novipirellula herctigrandis TaxID=2527986 RepID=A0A5C5Z203_9BACT|nr:hypothetical protein CA13_28610 [Planctomycetes bacterium CA13]
MRWGVPPSGIHRNHVLNDWFDHDGKTAAKYYLDVTEEDFAAAIASTNGAVGTKAGAPVGNQDSPTSITETKKPGLDGAARVPDRRRFAAEATLFVNPLATSRKHCWRTAGLIE